MVQRVRINPLILSIMTSYLVSFFSLSSIFNTQTLIEDGKVYQPHLLHNLGHTITSSINVLLLLYVWRNYIKRNLTFILYIYIYMNYLVLTENIIRTSSQTNKKNHHNRSIATPFNRQALKHSEKQLIY